MRFPGILFLAAISGAVSIAPTATAQDSSSKHERHTSGTSGFEAGSVDGRLYHNKSLGLTCAIPDGWVLRTDQLNDRSSDDPPLARSEGAQPAGSVAAKVLLAAFSHPPEARAPDVNSSILIAAESTASYPGLKDAAQYFGPLSEVAKAQGLSMDEDLYEVAVGARTLVRGDFHKDVGSRIMHQSTLVGLFHNYVVSFTIIAGSENEIEELIDGLAFNAGK